MDRWGENARAGFESRPGSDPDESTVNLVWLRSEKENGQPVEKRGTENIWAYLAKRYRVYLTKLSFTLLYNEPLLDPSVAMDRIRTLEPGGRTALRAWKLSLSFSRRLRSENMCCSWFTDGGCTASAAAAAAW